MNRFNLVAKVWLRGGVVGDSVSFSVENPVGRRISAVNNRRLVELTSCSNAAENAGFASAFFVIGIEAAVIRVGPEAPPTTTRGRAV